MAITVLSNIISFYVGYVENVNGFDSLTQLQVFPVGIVSDGSCFLIKALPRPFYEVPLQHFRYGQNPNPFVWLRS